MQERQDAASQQQQEEAGSSGCCKIIYEHSVPRTGAMGRFSFGSGKKAGAAAQASAAGTTPAAAAAPPSKGAPKQEEDVSAADMAKSLARPPSLGKRKKARTK